MSTLKYQVSTPVLLRDLPQRYDTGRNYSETSHHPRTIHIQAEDSWFCQETGYPFHLIDALNMSYEDTQLRRGDEVICQCVLRKDRGNPTMLQFDITTIKAELKHLTKPHGIQVDEWVARIEFSNGYIGKLTQDRFDMTDASGDRRISVFENTFGGWKKTVETTTLRRSIPVGQIYRDNYKSVTHLISLYESLRIPVQAFSDKTHAHKYELARETCIELISNASTYLGKPGAQHQFPPEIGLKLSELIESHNVGRLDLNSGTFNTLDFDVRFSFLHQTLELLVPKYISVNRLSFIEHLVDSKSLPSRLPDGSEMTSVDIPELMVYLEKQLEKIADAKLKELRNQSHRR